MTHKPAPQPPAEAPHFCPRTAEQYDAMDDMGEFATRDVPLFLRKPVGPDAIEMSEKAA